MKAMYSGEEPEGGMGGGGKLDMEKGDLCMYVDTK